MNDPVPPPPTVVVRNAEPRRRCWLWFHRWSKWVDVDRGYIQIDGLRIGTFVEQERRCRDCGKSQRHAQRLEIAR